MRFLLAKKEWKCMGCGNQILRGEVAMNQMVGKIPYFCHADTPQCYSDWQVKIFNQVKARWNRPDPRPVLQKRGRKQLYQNESTAKEVNRLKALQTYHKKQKAFDKVLELELKIKSVIEKDKPIIIRKLQYKGRLHEITEKSASLTDDELIKLLEEKFYCQGGIFEQEAGRNP